MASQAIAMSTWQYTRNGGGWQQGSGHDVSIGIDGGSNIYRGYIAFSLANFSASYIITSASLFFHRADAYGNKAWTIGLTDTKPPENFTTSAFKQTVSASYTSSSNSDNTVSITAAQLTPYVGKTVYVLFLNAGAGNSYGEIETDAGSPDKRPVLTVNYNYAKSTMSVSNGSIGSQQTITVTRQDNSYTHTLTAAFGGNTTTIATKSSSTTLTWTPAVATYAPLIPNAMSGTVTYTLTTYSGNTAIGTDVKTATLSLTSASVAPTLSLSVTDNKGYASHFNGKYIVGKSVFKVTATPSYKYSATQSSMTISANGSTYSSSPATTGVVLSGKSSISASVTDSRSQTASASTTLTLLAYANPNLSVDVQRCNSGGTADSTGAYCKVTSTFSITALDNINTRSLTIKYKKASASTYTSVARTISAYSGTDTYIFAADTDSSYDVQVVLTDYFSSATVNKVLPTISVVFDIYSSGTGMAFGKVAETANLLDIAWPIAVRNKDISIYDSAGTRRVYNHNYSSGINGTLFYNSDGTPAWVFYTDGNPSSVPLPINQGGSGQNATIIGDCTLTLSGASWLIKHVYQWGNVVYVQLYFTTGNTNLTADTYYSLGTVSGVSKPHDAIRIAALSGQEFWTATTPCYGLMGTSGEVEFRTSTAQRRFILNFVYIV